MITEQYVVTCAPEEFDRPYYSKVSPYSDVYKFYGVRGIGMLKEYEKEAQKYAWDLARMIANSPEYDNLHKIFGVDSIDDVLNMPFDEVLKICQEWEKRIKTGDICRAKRSDGKTEKVVVVSAGGPESPDVLVLRNNLQTVLVGTDVLEQTGESMANELDYILKALREEEK
jgi:hypothetical protein